MLHPALQLRQREHPSSGGSGIMPHIQPIRPCMVQNPERTTSKRRDMLYWTVHVTANGRVRTRDGALERALKELSIAPDMISGS